MFVIREAGTQKDIRSMLQEMHVQALRIGKTLSTFPVSGV